jgi:uncharacterized protein YecE (DUF72 family)
MTTRGRLWIGTSGWQYDDWADGFYAGVPRKRWLEHYAAHFSTVEVNATFYRLPEAKTFDQWRDRTPDDFVFAVKMSRYLTHVKRLREPKNSVGIFFDRAIRLGPKLGPVLLQLPPTLKAAPDDLAAVFDQIPVDVRVVVEPRHESWFSADVRALLTERGAALCLADVASRPVTPLWRTAPWTFLRLHSGRASPHPCYGRTALQSWSRRLAAGWRDGEAYVFFNNDTHGCAVRNAHDFGLATHADAWAPTRVP